MSYLLSNKYFSIFSWQKNVINELLQNVSFSPCHFNQIIIFIFEYLKLSFWIYQTFFLNLSNFLFLISLLWFLLFQLILFLISIEIHLFFSCKCNFVTHWFGCHWNKLSTDFSWSEFKFFAGLFLLMRTKKLVNKTNSA